MAKSAGPSLPETIASRLRSEIIAGKLPAGTALRQDKIAIEHGVSHIPVREALRKLEVEGFVIAERNRGSFVARLDAEDAIDLGDLRRTLECLAVTLAVPKAGEADWERAQAAIEAAEGKSEIDDWATANWDFHRALYAPAGRPRLMGTIEQLWRNADRYLRAVWQMQDYQDHSQDQHRAILAAFRSRDSARAVAEMQHHIDAATQNMVGLLRRATAHKS
ncbi:transcriptional regulator, GntR family [Tistlia consotensis]|uniref:Transcriptional regulator, GntR family n=1 Tax=Tistlia consotensis USBA 355 TaxID=560819 RepID=A0A1Y6BLD2_9PROT|nr:GntR family transcriptional regulator [Tistlia consotensis]SMF17194.1 transcriptional regulator, GntR family [Tistlia consotensis USBA 355]SNR40617.1 transcriptional regulator, GntR family [Tistlia consotensis]